MKLDRKELLEALNNVMPGVAKQEVLEQSDSFVFKDNKIFTYNGDICVTCPYPLKEDSSFAIKSKAFFALLNKTKKAEIELLINENSIEIVLLKGSATIPLDNEITLPYDELAIDKIQKSMWVDVPENFIDGLLITHKNCSTDKDRPSLTCVHLCSDYMESANNDTATRFNIEFNILNLDVCIPAVFAKELCKYSPQQMYVRENWVYFKMENNTIFACRRYNTEYPNIDFLFPDTEEMQGFTLPEKLNELLEKSLIFADDSLGTPFVTINIKNKNLQVIGEGNSGRYKEKLHIKTNQVLSFKIDPILLNKALFISEKIKYNDNFIVMENSIFRHTVALVVKED